MKNDVIADRYKELACASIIVAVNDFLEDEQNETNDNLFINWVYKCLWFDLLPLNRELFIRRVFSLRDRGIKHVNYLNNKGYKDRRSNCNVTTGKE